MFWYLEKFLPSARCFPCMLYGRDHALWALPFDPGSLAKILSQHSEMLSRLRAWSRIGISPVETECLDIMTTSVVEGSLAQLPISDAKDLARRVCCGVMQGCAKGLRMDVVTALKANVAALSEATNGRD